MTDIVLVRLDQRFRRRQRQEMREAHARAVGKCHLLDAPPAVALVAIGAGRHDHARTRTIAVADVQRSVDVVVVVARRDVVHVEHAPEQFQIARRDAGAEDQRIVAVGRTAETVAAALQHQHRYRFVDDTSAGVALQQEIGVVAVIAREIIQAGTVVQDIVVERAHDHVIAGVALQEIPDAFGTITVRVDEVVARAGIYAHDAAVAQIEKTIRRPADDALDRKNEISGRAGVSRGLAIDDRLVTFSAVDADIAPSAETRQIGEKTPPRAGGEGLLGLVHRGDAGTRLNVVEHSAKRLLPAGSAEHGPVAALRVVAGKHQFAVRVEHRQMQIVARAGHAQIGKQDSLAE